MLRLFQTSSGMRSSKVICYRERQIAKYVTGALGENVSVDLTGCLLPKGLEFVRAGPGA